MIPTIEDNDLYYVLDLADGECIEIERDRTLLGSSPFPTIIVQGNRRATALSSEVRRQNWESHSEDCIGHKNLWGDCCYATAHR